MAAPPPAAPNLAGPEINFTRWHAPLDPVAEPLPSPPCLGGDCSDGVGAQWSSLGATRSLAVGKFLGGRLVEGELFLTGLYPVRLVVEDGVATIGRPGYRIDLEIDDQLPWRGRVSFANGDETRIEWRDGRIVGLLEGVAPRRHRDVVPMTVDDELLAAAILVAEDLGDGRLREKPSLQVRRLETEPELTVITLDENHYVHHLGLIRFSYPDLDGYQCIKFKDSCELTIEGPAGQGFAAFKQQKLVTRPALVARPRVAWTEVVPGRIARLRGALVDSERVLADAQLELAKQPPPSGRATTTGATGDLAVVRDAARHALLHLRDAADALDDIVVSLPQDRASSARFEVMRDKLAVEVVKLELVSAAVDAANTEPNSWAELQRIATLPAIAPVRLELVGLAP